MRYINQSKPIKFSLLVGDRECHSVEEVKQNFDFNSLWDNLCNGSLEKWLGQIGETAMLLHNKELVSADSLTKKMCIYNLFAPEPLPSDEVNEDNVLKLLKKGCIKFGDLSGTPFANNLEIKKSVVENIDNATINRWCESDLELLKYVYSKKSYDSLNAQNCRRLIDENVVVSDEIFAMLKRQKIDDATFNQLCEKNWDLLRKCNTKNLYAHLNANNSRRLIDEKIVTTEDLIIEIAKKHNLTDILERYKPKSKIINIGYGSDSVEMILVQGYSGGDFYIGKYPVTQAQWGAVMGNNPSTFKGADNPVEHVSWFDCQDFIKSLNSKTGRNFRLPKEAEWEYAARGGNKTNHYRYSGSNNLDEVGWYESNSGRRQFKTYTSFYSSFWGITKTNSGGSTHPVGKKKPNELGIYDMSGNVWELCEDYRPTSSGHVMCGGSWDDGEYNCTIDCRGSSDNAYGKLGLRLVMDA